MRYDTEAIRRQHKVSDWALKRIKLARDGAEYRGLCPFHKEKTPSFSVVDAKGFYHCFGCGAHGDVIDFVANTQGVSFEEACAILAGERLAAVTAPIVAEAPERTGDVYRDLKPISVIPDSALPKAGERLRCWNPKRDQWTTYTPAMVFIYRDGAGAALGVVARIDLGNGKKITPTLRYVNLGGVPSWSHMPFDKPRPLYGLELLAREPEAPVLIVEGEKAADAAWRYLGEVTVTWPGGGKAVAHVDWSPLKGRAVKIWGDADAEGERAVVGWSRKGGEWQAGVAELVSLAGAAGVTVIPWDKTKPEGWDCADAERDKLPKTDIHVWLMGRAQPYTPPARLAPDTSPVTGGDPPDSNPGHGGDSRSPLAGDDAPFRCLGYDREHYYYLPRRGQLIQALSASAHTVGHLLRLAPMEFWERHFPVRGERQKFDLFAAMDALFATCESQGIFKPHRLRGRGAWIDDGRPVVHLGTRLFVDGKQYRPAEAPSEFIYEAGEPLPMDRAEPLGTGEAHRLIDIAEQLSWENPLSAQLLAGFCVIAPVCGALAWRSHIWITGTAGAGKTTVETEVLVPLIGPFALKRDGSTTEANIRQELGNDALPVLLDEAEKDDKEMARRLDDMLVLVRVGSSGGVVGKGGAAGTAVSYTARSCFCFISVNTGITKHSDIRRFSKLILRKNEAPDAGATFEALMADIAATFTPAFGARLFARTVANLPTLLENARIFTEAGAVVLKDRAAAQQLGALLAGAYLCYSAKPVTFETALEFMRRPTYDWTDYAATERASDERRLLATIALIPRRASSTLGDSRDFTVGELIQTAAGGPNNHIPIGQDEAERLLGQMGVKVVTMADGVTAGFVIANSNPPLAKALAGTPWASDWQRPLRTLGGKSHPSQYFAPGFRSRGVILPLSILTKEDDDDGHQE